MKTLITGSSGLVGSSLVESLFSKGYSIQCLKRTQDASSKHFWDTTNLHTGSNDRFHSVIHLAGENVASGRWTKIRKSLIFNSRVEGTRELVDYISLLPVKPKIFLSASAVGFYGNRGDELLDEDSSPGDGFLAEVCKKWENETKPLSNMGIRVIHLRFGMILSPNGGALHKMIPPFTMKVGGVVGNGKQLISWISIRDVANIVDFLIKTDQISGPVNVVTPTPTTNKDLTKSLGRALNCPTLFKVPGFMAKLIFGQMADEMLLSSTRATPKVLLDAGYQFSDTSLDETLTYCINNS